MTVIRFDRGSVTAITGRRVRGVAARVHTDGDELVYEQSRETRDRAELESMVRQLNSGKIPFTKDHPAEMLRGRSHPSIIGRVTACKLDGDHAVVDVDLDDPSALGDRRQLSLGYQTETIYLGTGYDLRDRRKQTDCRIDHLAAVHMARCGEVCSIKADAAPKLDPAADEAAARAAMISRISNAWRGGVRVDHHDCGCKKEPTVTPDNDRAVLVAALEQLRPGSRADAHAFATVAIAKQVVAALGEIDVLDGRNDYFTIAYAKAAIASSRHTDKFGVK